MKLECHRDKLRSAVGLAERITGKNLSLSVLGYILLSAHNKTITIRATNLDLGVEWHLPAQVIEPGEVLVSGSVFYNFLSNLSGVDKLTMELVHNNLTISTPTSSTLLKTYPVEDFPTLPELERPAEFLLGAEEFVMAVKTTAYAASLNDIKPEIASLYLYGDSQASYAVATDSFRLAEKKINLTTVGDNTTPKLLIPIRNVVEIGRLLETQSGQFTWRYNRNQLTITTNQLVITSRLIDGIFPDYNQIMPTKHGSRAIVERVALGNALKMAQIFTDRLNHVALKLRPDDQLLELTSQNGEVGENTSLIPAQISGEELTINFNLRYLLDGLQAEISPQLLLQFNGRTKPIMLTGAGDSGFRYLIMPLNR